MYKNSNQTTEYIICNKIYQVFERGQMENTRKGNPEAKLLNTTSNKYNKNLKQLLFGTKHL